jgi:hypothetical protein
MKELMTDSMQCLILDDAEADAVSGGNLMWHLYAELTLIGVCAYLGIVDGMAGTNNGEAICH